jgi:Asp-tRNA(Asn)/Glu-tRNA(Gln) amidotransferase A subunit family amidase
MSELTHFSAAQIAGSVRRREVSAVEVVEAHLRVIEDRNPQLNAYVHFDHNGALAAALETDRSLTQAHGSLPLLGVPVSIKSCIDIAGMPCEAGTRLRAGYVSERDAPLVRRLKHAGAIVLGVTNTPEMLMAYETDNLLYGVTRNPWDTDRSSGGSSGGEAAAIAAGMSAGGIGSDGGGSIRVPAHFCGICGLKPTPGMVPATGHFPECAGPWAMTGVVGPMARTVEDVRLILRVIAGMDDGDPFAAPLPAQGSRDISGARIALLETDAATADEPTRAAVLAAARALEEAGARVEPLRMGGNFEAALRAWHMVFCAATGVAIRPMIKGREAELSPIFRDFVAYTKQLPPLTTEALLAGLVERDQVRARVLRVLRPYRAMLAPVSSAPAFRHGEGGWGPAHPANYLETMSFSQFANAMGCPAASVPAAISPEGLPIGVQVIARPFEEQSVLEVAAAIEARSDIAKWPAERGRRASNALR